MTSTSLKKENKGHLPGPFCRPKPLAESTAAKVSYTGSQEKSSARSTPYPDNTSSPSYGNHIMLAVEGSDPPVNSAPTSLNPCLLHTMSDLATRVPVNRAMTRPLSGAPASAFMGSGSDIIHNIHLRKLFCRQTLPAELSKVDGSNTSHSPLPELPYELGPSQINMPAMKRYVVPSTDFNATACNAGFNNVSAGSYENPLPLCPLLRISMPSQATKLRWPTA